jgi:anti-anti-sigma factor
LESGRELLGKMKAAAEKLGRVGTFEELAATIYEIVDDVLPTDRVAIYFFDPDQNLLRIHHAHGFTDDERDEAERTALDRHPGLVLKTGQMLHVPDVDADQARSTTDVPGAFKVRARLFVPIKSHGETVGVLGLASVEPYHFGDFHIAVVEYATTTAGFLYKHIVDGLALRRGLELADHQRRQIAALSSPVVEVWHGVLVLPLIGRVDESRAADVTTKLLAAVSARETRAVILDLTGIETIDATSLELLVRIERAVSMLGGRCVFSGISAAAASTLARTGYADAGVTTFATMKSALGHIVSSQKRPTRHPRGKPGPLPA